MLVGEILTRNPHSTSHRPLVTKNWTRTEISGSDSSSILCCCLAQPKWFTYCKFFLPHSTDRLQCNARTLITVTQIISTSTGPISTKFARLVKLWPSMNDLKLFFLSLKGCCRGNQFCGHNRPPSLILRMTFTRAAPAYKNGNCYARHRQTNCLIR